MARMRATFTLLVVVLLAGALRSQEASRDAARAVLAQGKYQRELPPGSDDDAAWGGRSDDPERARRPGLPGEFEERRDDRLSIRIHGSGGASGAIVEALLWIA